MTDTPLTRQAISDAVGPFGWQLLMASIGTMVRVGSWAQGTEVAARVVAAGSDAELRRLRVDVRHDRVLVSLSAPGRPAVTRAEVELARRISSAIAETGLATAADATGPRPAQVFEIAIDALDAAAIRPFWLAVLGYVPEPGSAGDAGSTDPVSDPFEQGPTIWFQEMDGPRPQRNRIHFDVAVAPEQAAARIAAAIAAGGRVTYDGEAPAFWVLADPEGNEVCICTWQGRD